MNKGFVLLFLAFICMHTEPHAQTADSTGNLVLDNIETYKLHSNIIGDDYTIYVLKTDDYDTTNNKLPVLYMTDGDWNMTVAMNCFRMLRQDYVTHEPLVVGIGYGKNQNKRVRDLDPNGGGPKFLEFIEKEVMPFIDGKYRTNSERAIYGYSMGGMFTTYVLFNRSDLFQKIYIGAPGNNGRLLMPAAREYFISHNNLKSKVFIGVGSFEKEVVRNIDSFTTFLKSKKLPDLEIMSAITPDAGHGAGLGGVMQNAIVFGYCEKHKAVAVSPGLFKNYVGTYTYYENGKKEAEIKILNKSDKLFVRWNDPNGIPDELLPMGNSVFFTPVNERMTFYFGDNELVLKQSDGKAFKLVKEKK
jgi:predicted alpha/beta superfamily hydrolase